MAIARARSLYETCTAWTAALMERYAAYRDVVGPVQCAVHELQYGLDLVVAERQERTHAASIPDALVAANLLQFPRLPLRRLPAMAVLGQLNEQQTPGDGGAMQRLGRRLRLLLLTLDDCTRVLCSLRQASALLGGSSAWATAHEVFRELLSVWASVQREEERLEVEAAQTFKTKDKSVTLTLDEQV